VADSFEVDFRLSFDADNLERELIGEELRVVQEARKTILRDIQKQWVGWKYKGRDPQTVGNSRRAWKASEQTQAGTFAIIIENEAKHYRSGRSYTAAVRRSKGARPEVEIVWENLLESNLPQLQRDLAEAIARTIDTEGPPKRVRQNRQSSYQRIQIES